jgi:hypothetical protein
LQGEGDSKEYLLGGHFESLIDKLRNWVDHGLREYGEFEGIVIQR